MLFLGLVSGTIIKSRLTNDSDNKSKNSFKNICKYVYNKIKDFVDKFTIRGFVLLTTLCGIIVFTWLTFAGKGVSSEQISILLNFFLSFIFAWLLTEYSSEKSFNEKQKESAIRSYRHSINIKNKLDYTTKIVELLYLKLGNYNCINNNENKCELAFNVDAIKNYLILAKRDSLNNIYDWSDIISDELNIHNEILENEEKIKQIKLQVQESGKDINDEENCNHKEFIEDINKDIDKSKSKLNSKAKYTFENEKKFMDEHIEQINSEIDREKMTQLNKNRVKSKTDNLKARAQQIYSNHNNLLNDVSNQDI